MLDQSHFNRIIISSGFPVAAIMAPPIGDPITLDPDAGSGVLFDNAGSRESLMGDADFMTTKPQIELILDDCPGLTNKWHVTIADQHYAILDILPNGDGMAVARLTKKTS